MAMTKEQQKEAARRILEKFPMTEEEKKVQAYLETKPENYPLKRLCLECGAEFEKSDIEGHAKHLASHNPTAGSWVEAHRRIEKGRESAKERERQNLSV